MNRLDESAAQHARHGSERAQGYAFGESELAALRLKTVAEVFAPASRSFLIGSVRQQPELALDLGCGPGYSTRLLAETLKPRRTVGLDRASAFLERAREAAGPTVTYLEHDVTVLPFPTGPAELIYCRFLLSHLPHPEALVTQWATQLRPGGSLLLEEVEWIRTDHPSFVTYLGIVAELLDHHGGRLCVGPLLATIPEAHGLERRLCRVATLSPHPADAARMFLMNLSAWRRDGFVQSRFGAGVTERLVADLEAVAKSVGSASISWGLRQMAFQCA